MDYIKISASVKSLCYRLYKWRIEKGRFFSISTGRTKGIFSNELSGLIQKCSRVMKLRPISKALWGNLDIGTFEGEY